MQSRKDEQEKLKKEISIKKKILADIKKDNEDLRIKLKLKTKEVHKIDRLALKVKFSNFHNATR